MSGLNFFFYKIPNVLSNKLTIKLSMVFFVKSSVVQLPFCDVFNENIWGTNPPPPTIEISKKGKEKKMN